MKKLTKILAGVMLTLANGVMAYVPDRCDWQDCRAMVRGGIWHLSEASRFLVKSKGSSRSITKKVM